MSEPGKLAVGEVLVYRRDPNQSARVCRVSTFTVMLRAESGRFYTIPWSAVWRTFERSQESEKTT